MSTLSGIAAKGEKRKPKFQSLDINSLHRGESLETQQQRNTLPRKYGMQSLGKVPSARRPPANLPSLKSENSGNESAVSLVPGGSSGWSSQQLPTPVAQSPAVASQPPTASVYPNVSVAPTASTGATIPVQQPAVHGSDKLWSSLGGGRLHPPSYQSPEFQHEFPTLSGQAPATVPSLRPQTEGNWIQGGGRSTSQSPLQIPGGRAGVTSDGVLGPQRTPPPVQTNFPINFPVPVRCPYPPDNRFVSPHGLAVPSASTDEEIHPRRIIKEEDLSKMDDIARDAGWAACDDDIVDYNRKLLFSDDEDSQSQEKQRERKDSTQSRRSESALVRTPPPSLAPQSQPVLDDGCKQKISADREWLQKEEEEEEKISKQVAARKPIDSEQRKPVEEVEEYPGWDRQVTGRSEKDLCCDHKCKDPRGDRHTSSHFKHNLPPRFVKWAGWSPGVETTTEPYPHVQGSRNMALNPDSHSDFERNVGVERDERTSNRYRQRGRNDAEVHGWETDTKNYFPSHAVDAANSVDWYQHEERRPNSRDSRTSRDSCNYRSVCDEQEEDRRDKARHAPGPITHAKLEAAELQNEMKHSLTQLKRSSGSDKTLELKKIPQAEGNVPEELGKLEIHTCSNQKMPDTEEKQVEESPTVETEKVEESVGHKQEKSGRGGRRGSGPRRNSGSYTVSQRGNWRPRRGRHGLSHTTPPVDYASKEDVSSRQRTDSRRPPRSPKPTHKDVKGQEPLPVEGITHENVQSSREGEFPHRATFYSRVNVGRRVDGYGPPPSKSPFGRPTEGNKERDTSQEVKVKEPPLGTDIIRSRHYRGGGGGKSYSPQVPPRMQKKSENEHWVPNRSKGRGRGRGGVHVSTSSEHTRGAEFDSKQDDHVGRRHGRTLSPASRAPGAEKHYVSRNNNQTPFPGRN